MTTGAAAERRQAMSPDDDRPERRWPVQAANDNAGTAGPDPRALRKVDAVALALARIIGRRMAREDFAKAMRAANDNMPTTDMDNER